MKIPIHYCGDVCDLEIPDSCHTDVLKSPADRLPPLGNDHWIRGGALPAELREFLESSFGLLIVVNDQYRPTPTALVMQAIIAALEISSTTFLVATALHSAPTEEELTIIFGETYPQIRDRVKVHDAFDDDQLQSVADGDGTSRFNSLLSEFDRILIIGSVEPHYFAGFTGGRKIFLPGLSSFADTRRNHALAVSEKSLPLATTGNPVWEDIKRRTNWVHSKETFSIQLVTGHNGEVLSVASGDIDSSYRQARAFVVANFAHPIREKYDLVISVVYSPLDRNLYQLQKSYENVAAAVNDGGTILLISGCIDGVGDDHFLKLAAAVASGEIDLDDVDANDIMGIHKVVRTNRLGQRINLVLVSRLEPETLDNLKITPQGDFNRVIRETVNRHGKKSRVAVVLDSASQVLTEYDQSTERSCNSFGGKGSCARK